MPDMRPSARKSPEGFQPSHLIVHYNEVALKGKNRAWFEEILRQNIARALAGECGEEEPRRRGASRVRRLYGRLLVELDDPAGCEDATARLARVYGIAHLLPVICVDPSLDALKGAVGEALNGEREPRSFAVECKRSTKDFPFTSVDVERDVGAFVKGGKGWPVDLEEPELAIRIELVNKEAFLGFERVPGPGGLPTGVTGKVVCLISGGIDSPVAASRLLRRGATAVYVHFHSYPHTGSESQDKVRDLVRRIQPPGRMAKLYMVPFAEIQRKIVTQCSAPYRVLLYRRFMVRAARSVARREGALALVTGDNLGQVASQTLENLRAIEAAVDLPLLRPLIGMDKLEIIEDARALGTFEISIQPHGDCCSLFMPPNPATRSTAEDLDAEEKHLDVEAEVARLVEQSRVEEIRSS